MLVSSAIINDDLLTILRNAKGDTYKYVSSLAMFIWPGWVACWKPTYVYQVHLSWRIGHIPGYSCQQTLALEIFTVLMLPSFTRHSILFTVFHWHFDT